MHQQEVVRTGVNDRVGQTWNFPVRCEDGIHLVTGTIVETLEPWMVDDPGEYHRVLILESSSASANRQAGITMTVREADWSRWDDMSSWTRLG